MIEEIHTVDLELAAFLGSDFAQSVSAELGEEVVSRIWFEGYGAALDEQQRTLGRLLGYEKEDAR